MKAEFQHYQLSVPHFYRIGDVSLFLYKPAGLFDPISTMNKTRLVTTGLYPVPAFSSGNTLCSKLKVLRKDEEKKQKTTKNTHSHTSVANRYRSCSRTLRLLYKWRCVELIDGPSSPDGDVRALQGKVSVVFEARSWLIYGEWIDPTPMQGPLLNICTVIIINMHSCTLWSSAAPRFFCFGEIWAPAASKILKSNVCAHVRPGRTLFQPFKEMD